MRRCVDYCEKEHSIGSLPMEPLTFVQWQPLDFWPDDPENISAHWQ